MLMLPQCYLSWHLQLHLPHTGIICYCLHWKIHLVHFYSHFCFLPSFPSWSASGICVWQLQLMTSLAVELQQGKGEMPSQRGLWQVLSYERIMWRMGMQPTTPSAQARSSATEPPCIITCAHQGTSRAALHPSAVPHLCWVAMNTNSYGALEQESILMGSSALSPPCALPSATHHTSSPVFPIFALRPSLKVRLKSIKPGEFFSNTEPRLN